ncbi:hypothetical protein EWQ89_23940, partial [Salmonella enterica]|nr:hypothetical protein [Salmonella enterica]
KIKKTITYKEEERICFFLKIFIRSEIPRARRPVMFRTAGKDPPGLMALYLSKKSQRIHLSMTLLTV